MSMYLPSAKRVVAHAFSRHANQYETVASVQANIAEQMARLLNKTEGSSLLEIGSGTGVYTEYLLKKFPSKAITAIDLAQGMLSYARKKQTLASVKWVAADAAILPFQNSAFDGVTSNLVLQWCQDLTLIFREWRRVLQSGGWVHASLFIEGSFNEFQRAWDQVDLRPRQFKFHRYEEIKNSLIDAGFEIQSFEKFQSIEYYQNFQSVLNYFRDLGAGHSQRARRSTLIGKQWYNAFEQAFEAERLEAGLPLRFDWVIFTAKL